MKKLTTIVFACGLLAGFVLAAEPDAKPDTTAKPELKVDSAPTADTAPDSTVSKEQHKKMEHKKSDNPAAAVPNVKMQKSDSGLEWQDIKVGDGDSPTVGKTVIVHYTGWLKDGKKFDSSKDRNQPFSFSIGTGQVIKGWDEGVMSMKKGGVRKLFIPSALGYGDRDVGNGLIPASSTLVFEVELIDIK